MKWKEIFPNGCDVVYRHGHRAVVADDCIYFYGGGNWKICKQLHGYKVKENLNFLPRYSGKVCPGVACFGMVISGDRIIIFGGMGEFGLYSNGLYTLNIKSWTWRKHNFPNKYLPEPRIGHSFTISDDNKIYVFGGLINADPEPNKIFTPKYMNDLYILHMTENDKFRWEKLPTAIEGPCGRESHSAVFHYDEKENVKFLIVFGGMNTNRLGDLWFLDLKQLVWVQFEINGIPPSPRSLHSASVIGSKMYIFGGWVDRKPLKSALDPPSVRFETTNSLSYLDLDELKWVHCEYNDDIRPRNRAGHSAVTVNNRIYMWGGRQYFASAEDDSACTKDFWYLETEIPLKVLNVSLIKATKTSLEIVWDDIDNAECYIVEIHKINSVPIDLSKIRIKTNLPKVEKEKSCDQYKGTSIKRKLEELEITARKKFIADEMKEDSKPDVILGDEKANASKVDEDDDKNTKDDEAVSKTAQLDENQNIIEAKSDPQVKRKSPIKSVQEIDKAWLTVGIYKSNSCIVDGFYTFKINTTNLSYQNSPDMKDFIPELKAYLTDDTMYAFRIAAINLIGIGEWSKMFYFKTADVVMPSMPNNCKFIPSPQGLRLAWNPNPLQEKIITYSVYVAINKNAEKNEYSFMRIYEGKQPTCHMLQNHINTAYREYSGFESFVIFRITASNSIGISPPLLTTYQL